MIHLDVSGVLPSTPVKSSLSINVTADVVSMNNKVMTAIPTNERIDIKIPI
jgi:hypothetical protein